MKKNFLPLLLLAAISLLSAKTYAQSRLIHYWHFNYTPASVHLSDINANFSLIDTTKANIKFARVPGVVLDTTGYMDNVSGDALNARMGAAAGSGVRSRNPSDSMELLFYIPVQHYTNIKIKWEDEISSAGSGQRVQLFDYSLDSGMTWQTAGLSRTWDSTLTSWSLDSVTFDTNMVHNTDKFVFRIKYQGNTTGGSGNTRYDNVTVEGDTFIASSTHTDSLIAMGLIHYWNFNNFTTAYHNPGIPVLKADWSAIDTNKALLAYGLLPGTSTTYGGYIDYVGGDTINARMGATAGNGYRFRNPSDSAYMIFYIPTTGYKNIVVKYETETSSTASGMLQQLFSYSTDSGTTWKTTGLNMSSDSTKVDWTLVSLNFGSDTTVNNNAKLLFRIKFAGNTSGTSGNNRFDNITVEADSATYSSGHTSAVNNVIYSNSTCTLYPNPANNSININTPAEGTKVVMIYNAMGQKVSAAQYQDKQVNVNVAGLSNGLYFVNVYMPNGQSYTLRFIKN